MTDGDLMEQWVDNVLSNLHISGSESDLRPVDNIGRHYEGKEKLIHCSGTVENEKVMTRRPAESRKTAKTEHYPNSKIWNSSVSSY